MPLFILHLHPSVRAHDDADGWNVSTDVDPGRPQAAVDWLLEQIERFAPLLHDYQAYQQALTIKNDAAWQRLNGSWQTLTRQQRDEVIKFTHVAGPRIDAYLSGPVALELASTRERDALEVALEIPVEAPGLGGLRTKQVNFFAAAAKELGLSQVDTLQLVSNVAARVTQAMARLVIDVESAKQLLLAEVERLRRLRSDD
jgi:hypothetical protein